MDIMKVVNQDEFNKLMKEDAVLVDFFATWCGPCKMLSPLLESMASEYEGRCQFVKVDVDQEPDLAGQFGIMAVPTVILFKNGKQAASFAGYQAKPQVQQWLDSHLA
ncbi:thioredoxin [Catenisphaera adipataccumulans]|uniref:thioredoxin n=1 Tax=Catenisphaera adipataccumulans TaxID=700500 RepID=UPI0031B612EE